jgi:hypothetical protein
MSITSSKIIMSKTPENDNEVTNKKYVDENFIKMQIIPSSNLLGFNFSYQTIANDILSLEQRLKNNFYIQAYMSSIPPPQIIKERNLEYQLGIPYKVFITICRNFVNDPNHPPPPNFFKRATVVKPDGEILLDVITYKDDDQGKLLGLNYDRDLCYLKFNSNISDNSNKQNPINELNMRYPNPNVNRFSDGDVLFNPNNIDISNLKDLSSGLVFSEQHIVVSSERTYTYPTSESNLDIINSTGGIDQDGNSKKKAIKYLLYPNIGGRREIVQAVCQGWGFTTRNSSVYNDLPGYYVAKDMDLVSNGFKVVLRISYHKYI